MQTIINRSFNAGEISKRLGSRTDQVKYQSGASRMRNFIPLVEGAVQNRSGFGFVRPQHFDYDAYPSPPRAIPFIYSDDQSYVLVFEHERLSIVSEGTPQFETAVNISGVSQATPGVVTTGAAHGLTSDDLVWVKDVEGMTEINRRFFSVNVLTATTFELIQIGTADDVDTTGYTAYSSGGTIEKVLNIDAPWASEDLASIRFAQSGDIMLISCRGYPTYKLTRSTGPVWTLELAVYGPLIDRPTNWATSGTAGGNVERYQITAIDEDTLEESLAGESKKAIEAIGAAGPRNVTITAHGYSTGNEVTITFAGDVPDGRYVITVVGPNNFTLNGTAGGFASLGGGWAQKKSTYGSYAGPSGGNPVTITWNAVTGALEYNIYREINGVFGYIGTSATNSFEDLGYDVDPFDTPPVERDRFDNLTNYPFTVGIYQQRFIHGGSESDPEVMDAGRIGPSLNFLASNPIQADDSFSWSMASNKRQEVRHILEMERGLVFTQSSVFSLEGDQAGQLAPGEIYPRLRAQHGASEVPPVPIGKAILYVQQLGKRIREIGPDQVSDFADRDVTVYSRHLFDRNTIVSMTWSEDPHNLLWAARDDGVLLSFLYQREHQVEGWSQHDTGDGDEVVSVCAVPENGETILYAIIRRYGINASPIYYIERMAARQIAHAADGKFLDSYRFYEEENETVGDTLKLYFDDTVTPGTDGWWLEPTGTSADWTEDDVEKVFLLYGENGERIWCTCLQFVDADTMVVGVRTDQPLVQAPDDAATPYDDDVDEDVGNEFPVTLPYETSDWSSSVSEITDLWHLEGRQVYAVGDGYTQGPFTVANGSIELNQSAVIVVVGLQIIADLVTLEPENPVGETWVDREKTVGAISVRVHETDGLQVGLSFGKLQDYDSEWCEPDEYEQGILYTGRLKIDNLTQSSMTAEVFLRQSQGMPTTILGVYPQIEIGDN